MDVLIAIRVEAKKGRNFELADKVRNDLTALGITLEDRPEGTIWRRS